MKNFLRILADIALLPVSGCIFPGNREHSEVHPRVNEIKEGMDEMIAAVKKNSANHSPATRQKGH